MSSMLANDIGNYMDNGFIQHYGVKGQKWGVRRYQNEDGSYTKAGLSRVNKFGGDYKSERKDYKRAKRAIASAMNKRMWQVDKEWRKNNRGKSIASALLPPVAQGMMSYKRATKDKQYSDLQAQFDTLRAKHKIYKKSRKS